jgi:hypothetical protein
MSQSVSEAETTSQEEMFLSVLKLLSQLASKDFFDFDPADDADNSVPELIGSTAQISIREQHQEVTRILLYGLEMVVPWMSLDLLRSYNRIPIKYFSFLTYILTSYEEAFCSKIVSDTSEMNLLLRIVDHFLWGAGAIDTLSARLSLQGNFFYSNPYIAIFIIY